MSPRPVSRRPAGTADPALVVRPATAARWADLASSFQAAGLVEVARRSPTRPIVRLELRRR